MSCEPVIQAHGLGKCYAMYARPWHRMVELLGLGRHHRDFWALRGVSFTAQRGETVGIIGRNGSGKSTLLQLIAGTLLPSEGQVTVQGRVAALLELGSGFNPEFTGLENVYLNAMLHGLTRAQVKARLPRILAFADIGDFVHQPVRSYSSGMIMRLAFSVIAHVDADVLIVDEALAVGDAFFTQKCMRFLRAFQQTGTLLFVSHDTAAVNALCNRAVWLDAGEVVLQGPARTVSDAYLESFVAARETEVPRLSGAAAPPPAPIRRDVRHDLLTRSQLRNDIHVPVFDPAACAAFGEGSARLVDVALLDHRGRRLPCVVGGEEVVLEVVADALTDFTAPIVGFYLKDRLGQLLFGDNTYLSTREAPLSLREGERYVARFAFQMPRLQAGEYFFAIGLSRGTQEAHVVQAWAHEALPIRSDGQGLPVGIIGLPMAGIWLERA